MGETCNLTIRDGECVTYIERVEADHMLRLHLEPGVRAPLHCTAGGKLLLSQLGDAELASLLRVLPLTRLTPSTITTVERLKEELVGLRKSGIGVDNEEFVQGMVGIALPVHCGAGAPVAALVCHAAVARISLSTLLERLPILRAGATSFASVFASHRVSEM